MATGSQSAADCGTPLIADRKSPAGSGCPTMERQAKVTHSLKTNIALLIHRHRRTIFAVAGIASGITGVLLFTIAIITGALLGGVIPGVVIGTSVAAPFIFACSHLIDAACSRVRALQPE
ncbi:MAG: hypothetical protein OXF02_04410 [Simkaniaceae bacterium]|nr:hypothetical protein [Simkaniaceae bacterium]